MEKLAAYVEEMRLRHPRLTVRQMAMQAGLREGVVQELLTSRVKKATPARLKALADAWGTNEDYLEMMRLAGHPLLEPARQGLTDDERRLLSVYRQLEPDEQKSLLEMAQGGEPVKAALAELSAVDFETVCGMVGQLNVEQRGELVLAEVRRLLARLDPG